MKRKPSSRSVNSLFSVILFLSLLLSNFDANNISKALAQAASNKDSAADVKNATYVSTSQHYQISYPSNWHVYDSGTPGDYSTLDQVLVSSTSLIPNSDGIYPVNPKEGSLILIGFNSNNFAQDSETLNNFVDTYLSSPFFKPPSRIERIGGKEFVTLQGELGKRLFIANVSNVYSIFIPFSNQPHDQSTIDSIISTIQFTNNQRIKVPAGENPNSKPVTLSESKSNETSVLGVLTGPDMKMPWDNSKTFNFNGGPHGNGDTNYSSCKPYLLSTLAGIDFSLKSTDEVLAVSGGTITYYDDSNQLNGGVGKYVQVDHGNGWVTQYWHLSSVDQWVKDNYNIQGAVQQGQVLGNAGQSGGQSAVHLHLQLKLNGNPFGWDGMSIDGYVVHSILDASDTSKGLNYQGTLTRGSESLSPSFKYNCGSITRAARKYSGSQGTIEAIGGPVYSSNSRKYVLFDDEFNNSTLDSNWHWYREDPTHWNLTASPGFLQIITQPKDIWRSTNNAPLLLYSLQPLSTDGFEIQTRIVITPTANFHQGGLVIYGDDDNYVRLTYAYINGPTFEFAKEIGGNFQPIQMPAPPGINDFHLRIVKSGMNYSAYYSEDGIKWIWIGTHLNVNISPLEVGVLAFNAVAVTSVEIPADFDYFQLSPRDNYTFEDVPPSHPFFRYIEAFYNAGITTGCSQSPKLYCPDNLVTRAEMAVFIERAKGNFNPQPNPTGMFADMPYLTFTPFIEQFYNDGITTGCSSNPLMYCPTNNVNRAEMATFIERAIGHFNPQPNPTGMFSDVPSPGLEGLTKFIEQFYNDGITTGCASNPLRFCPTNNVTRAEMAVFIVRAFHIPLP